jgi:hypothetical protein
VVYGRARGCGAHGWGLSWRGDLLDEGFIFGVVSKVHELFMELVLVEILGDFWWFEECIWECVVFICEEVRLRGDVTAVRGSEAWILILIDIRIILLGKKQYTRIEDELKEKLRRKKKYEIEV